MPRNEIVFGFDVGKASLGTCARMGNQILALQSLLIPAEYGATVDFRGRRRALRTRQAHQKREDWLRQAWKQAGLIPLNSDDACLKREFPKRGDETIYNSALLRIALLQEKPLKEWQIFKALWASIQRRGYDHHCDWRLADDENDADAKENLDSVNHYQEQLYYQVNAQEAYLYPCYLEATLMGLWHWEHPERLKLRIDGDAAKVRQKGMVAPRALVEKEIRQLFENAQKQLSPLRQLPIDEVLYGPGQKPYASLSPEFSQYRGTEWDAQGVLSQKVPRFDNRILNKCQMLPKRNVCKANEPLNIQFNLLMKLKNLRFTDDNGEVGRFLSCQELQAVYLFCQENLSEKKAQEVTFGNLIKFIEKTIHGKVMDINLAKGEKIKLNASGRSRFCRPALTIMNQILLEGINPPEFDITPYVQAESSNGLSHQELTEMIHRLGENWVGFHVGDKRYLSVESTIHPQAREASILKLIGSSNNPVVRQRLNFFWQELKKMAQQHGQPDKVVLEFARGGEGLDGQKTANDWEQEIKANEKRNDRIREQLEECGLKAHKWNIERFRLAEEQQWKCPYSGEQLEAGRLNDYQVDHIVPVSGGIATDSFYNKVLCISTANQFKANRTPYEWLSSCEDWPDYLARVTDKNSSYSKKKKELLIRNDARELVDSYNGLAETAYIARLAQQIVSLQFGWGLQTRNDDRRVYVNDGKVTAKIRKIYALNELLLTEEEQTKLSAARDAGQQRVIWKKNRENDKHHALDAYCISYSQDLRNRRDGSDDQGRVHWYVPGLEESKAQLERLLLDLFPRPTRRNTKDLYPLETIYGYRKRMENGKEIHYLTVRKKLVDLLGKERKKIKDIYDLDIRQDLEKQSAEMLDLKAWQEFLKTYQHPQRGGQVNAVLIIESRSENQPQLDESGRLVFGEFKDFGNLDTKDGQKGITRHQFKHSKANKGQIFTQARAGRYSQSMFMKV